MQNTNKGRTLGGEAGDASDLTSGQTNVGIVGASRVTLGIGSASNAQLVVNSTETRAMGEIHAEGQFVVLSSGQPGRAAGSAVVFDTGSGAASDTRLQFEDTDGASLASSIPFTVRGGATADVPALRVTNPQVAWQMQLLADNSLVVQRRGDGDETWATLLRLQ